ncbi:MAG: DUF4080 domain-containing protein, partial [Deltaproteobacteria bacterium]
MAEIVLTTLNARYAHAAFGLRYLHANLGNLRDRAEILEFDISQRSVDVLETLLARRPRIIGLGVYIWNVDQSTKLVGELKRVHPDIQVVLGGPEVSHETESQEIVRLTDYVITGEADLTFPRVCTQILAQLENGQPSVDSIVSRNATSQALKSEIQNPKSEIVAKVVPSDLPRFADLRLPYDLYTADDIAHRVIYVEASRGCPYECEFCLSSLDIPVRQAPLDEFLAAMEGLLARGARQFKFVDRTFNLNIKTSRAILSFFLERYRPGLFLHFEMIPDRLPEALRDLIRQFPPGALQFEVGIQTFNDEVADLISRRQDNARVEENLRWLREETGVHVHADLIVGLPGESVASFARGFNRLAALGPQEIQVGMLKRLRGTPIVRHDEARGMVYSPAAPYEILQTGLIDYATMQRLRRFARYWDLVANSGNFVETTPLIWDDGPPFESFLNFSDWLFAVGGKTNGIALKRLAELLFRFLVTEAGRDDRRAASAVWNDYRRGGRSDRPEFLRPYLSQFEGSSPGIAPQSASLSRQSRHARKPAQKTSESRVVRSDQPLPPLRMGGYGGGAAIFIG